jgi:phosphoribosylformylglycinamidine cyclo-ligase
MPEKTDQNSNIDSAINTYAQAGVDTTTSDRGVSTIVNVLSQINTGRASRSIMPKGAYAAVLALNNDLGIAITTDGVGSKLILAEQMQRFDTVGIDCVAMNVNDIICVGATPIALVDYIAVEVSDEVILGQIAQGLRQGAEIAGVEIPAGELAVLPEIIRGHPSPFGFDLVGTCIGTINPNTTIDGRKCKPGDAIIGIPSSGLHSNGYTLARKILFDDHNLSLNDRLPELGNTTLGETLLQPTTIYVQATLELIANMEVKGLAHITGGGLSNLLRLSPNIGFDINQPLPIPPIFTLIQSLGDVTKKEMWDVFNMGCGFIAITAQENATTAIQILSQYHPNTTQIGSVTNQSGKIKLQSEL